MNFKKGSIVLLPIIALLILSSCDEVAPHRLDTIYVDSGKGNDGNTGRYDAPVRTVSRALSLTGDRNRIEIAPGLYSAETGEQFPLFVEENVILTGRSTQNSSVIIRGGGDYFVSEIATVLNTALLANGNNQIKDLNIQNQWGACIFLQGEGETTIRNNTLSESQYAVVASSSTSTSISNNLIINNTVSGIHSFGNARLYLRNNRIESNRVGLNIAGSSMADLGSDSAGNNSIKQNSDCDCYNGTDNTLQALGNSWDQDAEVLSLQTDCSGGNDLVSPSGNILFRYIPDQSLPLFPGGDMISLLSPGVNSLQSTTTPGFSWSVSGSPLAVTAVFRKPIIIKNGSIQNTSDIVWLWHSGIQGTIDGTVAFEEGISSYDNPVLPEPLERGRLYYWAAWAWDSQGLNIIHSSPVSYFTVAP